MRKTGPDLSVNFLRVQACFWTIVIPIETVLKSEGVHHFEFFPNDNTSRSKLASINTEATRWKANVLGPTGEKPGQQSHLSPCGKGRTLVGCVAAIKERILLFAVTVDVTVN